MKSITKKFALAVSALGVLSSPVSALADSSQNIDVKASVKAVTTTSSFGLNFDSVIFSGAVGTVVDGVTNLQGTIVNDAKYVVSTVLNYAVYVSSTELSAPDGRWLSPKRIGVYETNSEFSTGIYLDTTPAMIYSGGPGENVEHNLKFTLDLNPSLTMGDSDDGHVLRELKEDTDFNAQISFVYTGV